MMVSGYKKRKNTEAQIRRILIYSALLFLLSVAQSSFFSALRVIPATPDLILGVVSVIALTDTRESALITAIIGGIMTDAICGVGIYLSPIFYFIAVLILSAFTKKMMKSYLSWLALFPAALLLRALYTVGKAYIFGGGFRFTEILRYAVLPEIICTAIFSLALYPAVVLLTRIVRGNRELS